jgi:hypothetical protein
MSLDGVTTNENDRLPLDKGGLQGGLPLPLKPHWATSADLLFLLGINILIQAKSLLTSDYGP